MTQLLFPSCFTPLYTNISYNISYTSNVYVVLLLLSLFVLYFVYLRTFQEVSFHSTHHIRNTHTHTQNMHEKTIFNHQCRLFTCWCLCPFVYFCFIYLYIFFSFSAYPIVFGMFIKIICFIYIFILVFAANATEKKIV